MKKTDRLILSAYAGPFVVTLGVVVFILLVQLLLSYSQEITGKDLSLDVYARLIFFFALITVPLAMPLAVLLSSLITFGSLGEHNELTAFKGAGISLIRILIPVFIISVFLAFSSFWYNNNVVPWANLKAFSLLWDVKQKSPSLSLKKGAFYNGLQGYSIKVEEKFPDGKTLRGVMIYNHTSNRGNKEVILADSGRMYTIWNEKYLVLELFRGKSYHDQSGDYHGDRSVEKYVRNKFQKSQIIFNLSSFDLKITDEKLFSGHRYMRNIVQLRKDLDSLNKQTNNIQTKTYDYVRPNYYYHFNKIQPVQQNIRETQQDSLRNTNQQNNLNKAVIQTTNYIAPQPVIRAMARDTSYKATKKTIASRASTQAKNILSLIRSQKEQYLLTSKEKRSFTTELYKKYTFAFACITMFLIGAPLGAIIKKGGLGIPVLISIFFFIVFYVFSITGEKWVKEGTVHPVVGMWGANFCLLCIGAFFLRQARNDSRILEADWYYVLIDTTIQLIKKRKPELEIR